MIVDCEGDLKVQGYIKMVLLMTALDNLEQIDCIRKRGDNIDLYYQYLKSQINITEKLMQDADIQNYRISEQMIVDRFIEELRSKDIKEVLY